MVRSIKELFLAGSPLFHLDVFASFFHVICFHHHYRDLFASLQRSFDKWLTWFSSVNTLIKQLLFGKSIY